VQEDEPDALTILYDSPRQLCDVLWGAVEGAAERYRQRVLLREASCMKQGAPVCRLQAHFSAPAVIPQPLSKQQQQRRHVAELVLATLPQQEGMTLSEVQANLRQRVSHRHLLCPRVLQEALWHLQHAGLVASTADQPGEDLFQRRYWRL